MPVARKRVTTIDTMLLSVTKHSEISVKIYFALGLSCSDRKRETEVNESIKKEEVQLVESSKVWKKRRDVVWRTTVNITHNSNILQWQYKTTTSSSQFIYIEIHSILFKLKDGLPAATGSPNLLRFT